MRARLVQAVWWAEHGWPFGKRANLVRDTRCRGLCQCHETLHCGVWGVWRASRAPTDGQCGSAPRCGRGARPRGTGRGRDATRLSVSLVYFTSKIPQGEAAGEVSSGDARAHDPRDARAEPWARADRWRRARRRRGLGAALGMLVVRARELAGWLGVRAPEDANPATRSGDPEPRPAPRSGRVAHASRATATRSLLAALAAGPPG